MFDKTVTNNAWYNLGFKDALKGALEIVENNDKIDAITEIVIAMEEN